MRLTHLLLPTLLACATSVRADSGWEAPPAPVPDFLAAVTQAPALRASGQRMVAARERIGGAGRWADPQVEAMGSRMFGPMDGGLMWEISLRQPLPRRGERAADRARAAAAVALAEADYAGMAGGMAAELARAIAQAEGTEASRHLRESQIARLQSLLQTITTRLSSGHGRVAERLVVQSRLAALQLLAEEERQQAADARSDAAGWLGWPPGSVLPEFSAPDPAEVIVEEMPDLLLADARGAQADAMAQMARASARPMTAVGLRFSREDQEMGTQSTIGLAIMSEIPWRSRFYAGAEERAALAERAAARQEAAGARTRLAAALARVERAERLAEASQRLGGDTVRRLQAEYAALVLEAATGSGPGESTLGQAVVILDGITETERQILQAQTALRMARAELWRYLPASRWTAPSLEFSP